MNKSLMAALILGLTGAFSLPAFAEGAGKCGKGKIWDADQSKCVAKPRGAGSNPGSH